VRPKLLSTKLAVNLLPAVGVSIIAAAIQLFPQSLQHIVRYDRAAIAEGEFWRIITGHLAHLGWNHLVMNVAGLWLVTYVFAPAGKPWLWTTGMLATAMLTSAGLYFFNPQLSFYVGLSGVLYGIIVIGALRWIQEGDWMGLLVLVIVAAKIGWEQTFGALPLSQQMAGGPVAVDAHLCGALGGLVIALWSLFRCERETS
jgi:rhomboid family GlyGly-CTERM serine protease